MSLNLPIWRQLSPPEYVAVLKLPVCRCAVVTLPGMQQSHRWNRCESSQTSSQLRTSRHPVRADPFKWSCHFITLKESEREREDGERDGKSTCQTRTLPVKRCWWAGNTQCVRLVFWRCGERDISHVSLGQTRWILGQMEQSLSVAFIICSQTIVSVHK